MASELITSTSRQRGFLATPSYLRLWFAGGIGNAMRWLELLVAGIFTYETTQSTVLVALVTVARSLPMLFIGSIAGVFGEALKPQAIAVDAAFRHGCELGRTVRARVLGRDPGLAHRRWRHRRWDRVGDGACRAPTHDRGGCHTGPGRSGRRVRFANQQLRQGVGA